MSFLRLSAFTFVVALVTLFTASRADALEPAYTAGSTQISGGPRIGTDNLNFGLGVRVGHTLDNNLYLGGTFDYFFGESNSYGFIGPGPNTIRNISSRAWMLSFEGGYDFHVAERLVVRPIGGLGIIGGTGEVCYVNTGCVGNTDTHVLFTFGGLLHYFVTEKLFIGPDLRIVIANDAAFIAGGHFGVAF